MALIPFPSGALVTRSELALQHPGQRVLRSLYGAGSQVLARGPGSWAGRLEIGETDHAAEPKPTAEDPDAFEEAEGAEGARRAIELFLTRLRGSENPFEAPVARASGGTLDPGAALTVSAVSATGGTVSVTVSEEAEGLVAGDFARIGGRLYQLVTDQAGSAFEVEPPVAPEVGEAVVWENVTCLARRSPDARPRSRFGPDFGGPWEIEWEEAL